MGWMDMKTRPMYMWSTRDPGTHKAENEEMKKIFHVNGNQKKAGVVIFISDKIDF